MSVTSRLTGLYQALSERLSQLDTKLLCFRSPQHLSRHLLDATTLLLLDRGSVYYCTGKKKELGVAQQVKVQLQHMTAVF